MPSVTGTVIAAGIGAAGSLASGALSSSAAKDAASTQASAGRYAADLQLAQFEKTNANLAPFRSAGQGAVNILSSLYGIPATPLTSTAPAAAPSANPLASTGSGGLPPGYQIAAGDLSGGENQTGGGYNLLDPTGNVVASAATPDGLQGAIASLASPAPGASSPATTPTQALTGGIPGAPTTFAYDPAAYGLGNGVFKPTEAELVQTPGYKFNLDQGLRSVQNSAAARGLATSGAALKGAASYATGLADNTLNTQANIYGNNVARTAGIFNSNLSNYLNPLEYLGTLGENAGAQTGTIGAAAAGNAGNALIGAANASAAGTIGSANAISNGLSGVTNAGQNYLLYSRLLGSGGGGGDGNGFYSPGMSYSQVDPSGQSTTRDY